MPLCRRRLSDSESAADIVVADLAGAPLAALQSREWRFVMPLLKEAGLESWAIDILGWGFSELATIFGNALRLESLKPEKKLMWKKEMDCLLSVCDYIVVLVPPSDNGPELEIRHLEQQI